jgi:hypothetical protein
MIQMSGVPEQRSALEAGKVQGAMLPRPDNFVALKKGFYNLMDCALALSKHRSGHNPNIHS